MSIADFDEINPLLLKLKSSLNEKGAPGHWRPAHPLCRYRPASTSTQPLPPQTGAAPPLSAKVVGVS